MSAFYEGLADILEIDVAQVTPELNLDDHGWDSLAIVSTIALVDDCYGVLLDGKSLGDCDVVGDIDKLIASKRKD